MKNLYITKKFISEEEFSELDLVMKDEFGFDEDAHVDFVTIEKGKPKWGPDTEPIRIDQLIESLERMKNSGATHVSIDYHVDHIGYEMASFQIVESTPSDIDMYESELEEEENNYRTTKKAELLRQLRDLED
jgi:hypothetical protein